MKKCESCGKKTNNTTEQSDNGQKPAIYCDECGGFPNHEYSVTCPNCNIEILVN